MTPEQKHSYIALYLLKKLDLPAKEGGMDIPVVVPSELAPIDDHLQDMAVSGYVEIDVKKGLWKLTKAGIEYLRAVIDEAADLVDELDELELHEAIAELEARNLDVFRARFLWGWFEGEFDDLVLFQERRGVKNIERMWAFYLTSDDFFLELQKELGGQKLLA